MFCWMGCILLVLLGRGVLSCAVCCWIFVGMELSVGFRFLVVGGFVCVGVLVIDGEMP